ncbi:hypothetical protein LOTGIDRAFT_159120 [Lottia gigantea]|uniref:IgGFc-binding protein N-terminal domain-containing protein n=1 Tax=Lottia gigantea TaxID=225164 RepID=V4ATS9_LOTGI|nr:hypothetical protein LOTGIDRAFT_159120 [Lottia gigantea]ESO98320.1 hypothetical protein LOTGIDRAFT_159120 [Lottia gigantea]
MLQIFVVLSIICVSSLEGCKEQCLFHYDVTFNDAHSRCGHLTRGDVTIFDSKAVFSGDGYISLPVFERNTLQPYFAMAFKVKYTGKHGNRQKSIAILSNGCGESRPSIELSLLESTMTLKMVLTVDEMKSEEVVLSVPNVDIRKETLIKIGQDGNKIQFKVGDKPIHVMEKGMYEHIVLSECPLQIGSGYGLLPLVGEFDEFVFYPCINEGFFEQEIFP